MTTFQELDLIAPLQRALRDAGYETPTEIQSRAIPEALHGRDILGCAQTGTGKTAAFVLPILDYLGTDRGRAISGTPFVLMLAPTRELAIQIGSSIKTYGKHLKLRTAIVYGGVNQSSQVRSLRKGAHILVATPGRLLDLVQQGHIELGRLEVFVLDEADRMMDMGFLPDLKRIIGLLPEQRQSLFFSATLEPKISEFAKSLLHEPVTINVSPKKKSIDKIQQTMQMVESREKRSRLTEILVSETVQLAVVFTRTKRTADTVAKRLTAEGIQAAAIHGNKTQANRQRTLDKFRRGRIQVLVATDVAARGIDVNDVSHVINYDIPTEPDSYVHRIGRTGRAGAQGQAITFYTPDQHKEVRAIERYVGIRFGETTDSNETQQKPQRQRKRRSRNGTRSARGNSERNANSERSGNSETHFRNKKKRRPQERSESSTNGHRKKKHRKKGSTLGKGAEPSLKNSKFRKWKKKKRVVATAS